MSTVEERAPVTAEQGPPAPPPRRTNWLLALMRNSWRQLTSMRTALILLFLLAVAAIPGSLLPQRNINIEKVSRYFIAHPKLAPVLDRLSGFDVFASPWFSAIYVLLFTSLVGCIVPRLRDHVAALRRVPPDAPKRLERLPQHAEQFTVDEPAGQVAEKLRRQLRGGWWSGWRAVAREQDGGTWTVSAEKGFLKETGNLLFHTSLIAVLFGVAFGSWYGWHANRLLVAGPDTAFCNSLQQYDEYGLGARVDAASLPPFCLELTDFTATYQDTGEPKAFHATAILSGAGSAAGHTVKISVNEPLRMAKANVYLLGHGYAPIIRYTDRYGRSQTTVAPFLPTDQNLTSEGVAAFPDANVNPATGKPDQTQQVAFQGLYLPTAANQAPFTQSVFPAERSPALMLWAYRGNLGLDAGIPSSVYSLDQSAIKAGRLKQVGAAKLLHPGQSMALDDGTKVEFLGTRQWASLSVRYDPGERIVLASVALLLVGLMASLSGKRRRVWFRVSESTTSGSTIIEAGGLARTDYPGFGDEFAQLVAHAKAQTASTTPVEAEPAGAGDVERKE